MSSVNPIADEVDPTLPTCAFGPFVQRSPDIAALDANLLAKRRPFHEAGHLLANYAMGLDECTRVDVRPGHGLTAYKSRMPDAQTIPPEQAAKHALRSLAGPACEFMLFGCRQESKVVLPAYAPEMDRGDFDYALRYLDRSKEYPAQNSTARYALKRTALA